MNRRSFRTLWLPGGCIQGTKDLKNYIGATQQKAPSQEEEEEEKEEEEEAEEEEEKGGEEEGGGGGEEEDEEEEEEEEEGNNEEELVVRQGASDANASAARYRNVKLANDCLDSIDLEM